MKVSLFAFLTCLCLLPRPGMAKDDFAGPIRAEVIRVIDGDTFDVRAEIWLGQSIETRVRLNGLDTPELRGKCEDEKQKARAARAALEELVLKKPIYLEHIRYGKFAGRVLATAKTAQGIDLTTHMIETGYARNYDGGKRKGWCL